MKTISLACYNRTEYLKQVISSLKNQVVDLRDYTLVVSIDCDKDGMINRDVATLINDIDFIRTDVYLNRRKLGINGNTFNAIQRAHNMSEHNLYIEDDTPLSPDALNLYDWYTRQNHKGIASMILCNLWGKPDNVNEVQITDKFCGWGFATTRAQFEKYFKPVWFPKTGCWDNSSAKHIRELKGKSMVPNVSRSTNIGVTGTNMGEQLWKRFMGNHVSAKHGKFNYAYTGRQI